MRVNWPGVSTTGKERAKMVVNPGKGVAKAEELLSGYGPYALFAAFTALGMGIPVPMLVLFGSLGVLVETGVLDQREAVLLVFLATVTGDTVSYLLFYFGGQILLEKIFKRFPAIRPQVERVERWYRRYGLIAIIIFRWINWGQGQVIWLSGLSRLPAARFFPVMAGVNLGWAAAWSYVGIGSISAIRSLAPWVAAILLGLLAALALGAYLVYRRRLPLPARLAKLLASLDPQKPDPAPRSDSGNRAPK